jgi:hypothetical protein
MRNVLSIVAICVLCCGCADSLDHAQLRIAPLRAVTETPQANLPQALRPYNWVDAGGSGSCVNASTVYNSHWSALPELAKWWRANNAGGETDYSIRRKHDAAGVPYFYTLQADPTFLNWVSDTRRSALIWYYDSHCVNFVGFARDPQRPADPQTYAWLCDNNRPSRYIPIPRETFLRNWAHYGGFALALKSPPVPPPLFPASDRS